MLVMTSSSDIIRKMTVFLMTGIFHCMLFNSMCKHIESQVLIKMCMCILWIVPAYAHVFVHSFFFFFKHRMYGEVDLPKG